MIVRTHRRQPLLIWLCATGILLGANGSGSAQETSPAVSLTVRAGRPLRVALDGRLRIERTRQQVTGTIVEPIYAYDRVVIPAGVKVAGHVSRIDRLSKMARMRAFLRGDLTPNRNVVLEFDTLRLDDGDVAIQTVVTSRIENLRLLRKSSTRARFTTPSS